MQTIEVENLTKDYGFGRGVFDVSISVKPNDVFGFLGPNGACKSTTIRHLMGFSKPDGGLSIFALVAASSDCSEVRLYRRSFVSIRSITSTT